MSKSIFIIAHAPLASALKNCAMHVYSCDERVRERIVAIDVAPDDDIDQISQGVAERMRANPDKQTLILTDLVGATPSNIAESFVSTPGVVVATGINLPMVLTAVCHRDEPFDELVDLVMKAGRESISRIPAA
ncbi:MAG: PTS sugar transporter subunit IIA [Sutterellaceae bacterium]|nr:PTS sugar transporter subunit IIA [Sutterellaceae bacterium]